MELKVYNIEGKETGRTVQLSESIFGIEPNEHAVYLDVKQYLANQRQGTHKSKDKSEIARTTKKAFRQKGTGGARRGSYKSGVVRGGARIHGPQPRDYSFKLNKKLKNLARVSALSSKAKINEIMVVENFSFDKPLTKNFVNVLNNLSLVNKKTLFVFDQSEMNVVLSSRNIPKTKVMQANQLNTYAILDNQQLVIAENSFNAIQELLG